MKRVCSLCFLPLIQVIKPNLECVSCNYVECFRCSAALASKPPCRKCGVPLAAVSWTSTATTTSADKCNKCTLCHIEGGHLTTCANMAQIMSERRAKAKQNISSELAKRQVRFQEQQLRLKEERDPLQRRDASRGVPSFSIHTWMMIFSHIQQDFPRLTLVCRRFRSILEALPVVSHLTVTRGHTSSGGAIGVLKAMNPLQHTHNDLRFRCLKVLAIGTLIRMTEAAWKTLGQLVTLETLDLRGDGVSQLPLEDFDRYTRYTAQSSSLPTNIDHPSIRKLHLGVVSGIDRIVQSPLVRKRLHVLSALYADYPSNMNVVGQQLTSINVAFGHTITIRSPEVPGKGHTLFHYGLPATRYPTSRQFPVKSVMMNKHALSRVDPSDSALWERLTVIAFADYLVAKVPRVRRLTLILDVKTVKAGNARKLKLLPDTVRHLEIRCPEECSTLAAVVLELPESIVSLRCEMPLKAIEGAPRLETLAITRESRGNFESFNSSRIILTTRNNVNLFDVDTT